MVAIAKASRKAQLVMVGKVAPAIPAAADAAVLACNGKARQSC